MSSKRSNQSWPTTSSRLQPVSSSRKSFANVIGPVRVDPDPDQGDRLERLAMALIRLAQRPLRGQLLGDVAKGPDAPDDLAAEPLRRRVALDRPAVHQLEDVAGGDRAVLVDLVHAADELLRLGHAVEDAGGDRLEVVGVEQALRDRPELRERAVVSR